MNTLDRIPPQALDVERVVLGSALTSSKCAEIVVDQSREDDFYSTAHQQIFRAITSLHRRGAPIDLVAAVEELRKMGALDQIGGEAAVAELCEFMAAAESIEHHTATLRDKAILRGIINNSTYTTDAAFEPDADHREIIAKAEQSFLDLTSTKSESRFYRPGEILGEVFADADRAAKGELPGLPTGFGVVDKSIGGLEPGQLIIIAGRPSMGKTSLALQISANISKRGQRVAFFSIEMNRKELTQRLLCNEAEIDLGQMRTGLLPKRDYAKIALAAGPVSELPLHIEDSASQTTSSILSKSRQLKRNGGLGLVVVDHLGLMTIERGQKSDTRNNDLSTITRGLKLAAKILDVPIVILSQLSREVERRPDHRPILSDLRDSGAIEQDADIVLFVYREEQYTPTPENRGRASIIIGKQRNGPIGSLNLFFKEQCAKFHEDGVKF